MTLIVVFNITMMSALAATPTDKSLRELVSVTKLDETIKQTNLNDSRRTMITDSLLSSVVIEDMSEEKRQQLKKVFEDYSDSVFNSDSIATMNEAQVQAYMNVAKKHFTQKEVDAQIKFYQSDVGKGIIKKQPAMMRDYANEVRLITTENMTAELKKALPILQKEIKALVRED